MCVRVLLGLNLICELFVKAWRELPTGCFVPVQAQRVWQSSESFVEVQKPTRSEDTVPRRRTTHNCVAAQSHTRREDPP